MRIFFYFVLTTMFSINLPAQTGVGCDGARYRYRIFDEISVDYDIPYGNNISATGSTISLVMDIYQPVGDVVDNRPVVVVAHGGFFLGGSNNGLDVVPLCEDLARMGYVAASISYRLGIGNFFNLESSLQEATIRGVQDAKAAVRYLRKSHAIEGNIWGIDPERIVLGGSSAGGFIAIHAAYVDDLSEVPSTVNFSAYGLTGGIEGDSGSPGYSSELLSIFSISGAIGDDAWISAGDIPVVSTHGTNDGTVPFGTGYVQLSGLNVTIVDGSEIIHNTTDLLGIDNCFHAFPGAGHTPHASSTQYYDTTRAVTVGFTSRQVCPLYPPICGWYDVDSPPPIVNTCPADIVADGLITVADVLEILGQFGCELNCFADVDGDGAVTVSDVLSVLAVFGEPCPN
jgi:para-nitrobenzyl esterase|tara:strand:- start:343 stop:1539 length:1197 start_codon:yes stop_codon:yes gene_type:complete